jgi:hypothetical protein
MSTDSTDLADMLDEAFRRLDNLDQLVRDALTESAERIDRLEASLDADKIASDTAARILAAMGDR